MAKRPHASDEITIRATDLTRNNAEPLNQVFYQNRRIVITKHRRPMAALVPMADLEKLRALDAKRKRKAK